VDLSTVPISGVSSTKLFIREGSYARAYTIILLVVLLLAVIPAWPYSSGWGYYPSGLLAVVLVVVIVLLLVGIF
jgi:Protein of unknown function (DUF3309)